MVRPTIHSVKHFSPMAIDQISTGAVQNNVLISAVVSTVADVGLEVTEGSLVKAIYIELWLQNQGDLGEFIAIVEKVPEGGNGATFANMANLFSYPNKKNIFYTTQGLTSNDGVSGPVNVMRQWFKIPKGKQRFGLGDRLVVSIANVSANDLNRCGTSIFKEYR